MTHNPGQHGPDHEFLILDADGLVVNAVVGMPPSLPEGWEAVCRSDAPEPWIGWMRIDGEWVDPNPPEDDS